MMVEVRGKAKVSKEEGSPELAADESKGPFRGSIE